MLKWIEPVMFRICAVLGDWMMFAGLILLIVIVMAAIIGGMEALLERSEHGSAEHIRAAGAVRHAGYPEE